MIRGVIPAYEQGRTLCFTGHRPERLPQETSELLRMQSRLSDAIEGAIERGVVNFVSGAMSGFDTLAAEQVLRLKEKYPQIQCIMIAPFSVHFFNSKSWTPKWSARLREVIRRADYGISLSEHYHKGVYYERDRVIVSMASEVIAYYDGGPGGTAYTVNWAKEKGLTIYNLYEGVQ